MKTTGPIYEEPNMACTWTYNNPKYLYDGKCIFEIIFHKSYEKDRDSMYYVRYVYILVFVKWNFGHN